MYFYSAWGFAQDGIPIFSKIVSQVSQVSQSPIGISHFIHYYYSTYSTYVEFQTAHRGIVASWHIIYKRTYLYYILLHMYYYLFRIQAITCLSIIFRSFILLLIWQFWKTTLPNIKPSSQLCQF